MASPNPSNRSNGSATSSSASSRSSGSDSLSSTTPTDQSVFVDDLLEQMEIKFSDIGHTILGSMDEMGNRMDELENSIQLLMEKAKDPSALTAASSTHSSRSSIRSTPKSSSATNSRALTPEEAFTLRQQMGAVIEI